MNNKVLLVTGSSSGLGSKIILEGASKGYNVVITYLSHKENALNIKEKVEKEYKVKTLALKCDICIEEDIINLKNKIIETFGKIDILVNNASVSHDDEFDHKNKDNFMKILETNLVGTFLVSRIISNEMKKNKSVKIINIASTNGIDTFYEYGLDYDAYKAGVINLTHNLSNHYAPYITVNAVCPGWINTPMNKDMDESFKNEEENKILLHRFAEPKEIASLVLFLCSDESSYINDIIIRIDGGINAK